MNDAALALALERMQALLGNADQPLDPGALAEWNHALAMAQQEGAPGSAKAELVAQAQALGEIIQQRVARLTQERERIRAELKAQEQGGRALKGYGAGLG
jgi:flagellar hook-associated protein FlgK